LRPKAVRYYFVPVLVAKLIRNLILNCAFKEWVSSKTPVVMGRVLGTTPSSSSLQPLLTTLSKQISYNLDISYEDIPQDLVPLKTYFKVKINNTVMNLMA
jgi:hypothetical protein